MFQGQDFWASDTWNQQWSQKEEEKEPVDFFAELQQDGDGKTRFHVLKISHNGKERNHISPG